MKTYAVGIFAGISLLASTAALPANGYNSAIYEQLGHENQQLYERCIQTDGQNGLRACRLLARAQRRDVDLLELLAAELEESSHYAKAIAVYDEGLKNRKGSNALKRKRTLAASNLRETQNTNRTSNASDDTVASTLDTIKCLHLALSDALPACERALAKSPGDKKIRSRLDKALALVSKLPAASDENENGVAIKLGLLKDLRDGGLISQADYQRQKQSLLGSTFDTVQVAAETKPAQTKKGRLLRGVDVGSYHALVIGSDDYQQFPDLETAINDASAVAEVLERDYGFNVSVLTNAKRYDILSELSRLRRTLLPNDNLLVFYAGHGILDKATARGYWLPVDAEKQNNANWLSTADITDALKGMRSKHVLVVSDSCYSGSLSRDKQRNNVAANQNRLSALKQLVKKRSRTVLSSGGLEPVLDSGGGNHSVFTSAFLTALKNNNDVLEANAMFPEIRDQVISNAEQTPEYRAIQKSGHDGGDFVFVRKNSG